MVDLDQHTKMAVAGVAAVMQSVVTVCEEFFWGSLADDEYSSDKELLELTRPRKKRRIAKNARIPSFVEVNIKFTHSEFQSHFRLPVSAFEWLLNRVSPQLSRKQKAGCKTVCPKKQLMAVLWLLATPDSFRSVACRFKLSKGSFDACFFRVIYALNGLSPSLIAWPNAERRKIISQKFKNVGSFEGVVGVVDCTYCKIRAPTENASGYINQECFRGITLQAICDDSRRFMDCFSGYPGSVSDTRIFRQSYLYKKAILNADEYFSPHEYVLGDKAYEMKTFCIPPYREGRIFTDWQRTFNHLHAKTRQVIKQTFSLFFGRFRRFKDLNMTRKDLIPCTIIAACVLHNICLAHSDDSLREQFEAEGTIYLNERQGEERIRERETLTAAAGNSTNVQCRAFRDQLADEMGLVNEESWKLI